MTRPSDEQLAFDVKDAAERLNRAASAAAEAGIEVDIEVHGISRMGKVQHFIEVTLRRRL